MTDIQSRSLLPAGLRDILPPFAEQEAEIAQRAIDSFSRHGYQRVKPPLIEFEESLFAGAGRATSKDAFRVMDPLSQRMMGLRQDMTPQLARIAATRLKDAPRPLRLSYYGQVLQIKGSQLRPQRQFGQAGVELIGVDTVLADVEVIVLAANAARDAGVEKVSIDLTLPTLAGVLLSEMGGANDALRDALQLRDMEAVLATSSEAARLIARLIDSVGAADAALPKLLALSLPPAARALRDRLEQVIAELKNVIPWASLTIDPVETRSFGYQSGLGFTLFTPGFSGELGRGGRYEADNEPAVGATLFLDALVQMAPPPAASPRVFVPAGLSPDAGERLRKKGWVTIAGLTPAARLDVEARRMKCDHYLGMDGDIHPV